MPNWTELTKKIERLLRLKDFPIAFKLLEDEGELKKNPWVRISKTKHTLCQYITKVRTHDWTVGVTAGNLATPICAYMLGFVEEPQIVKDGTYRTIKWFKSVEESKKFEKTFPHLPFGKNKALIMAPLVYNPFDPDIVLIYANPAQMIVLINALQYENYQVMEMFCVGESSCSDVIARCYTNKKPQISIPCYGERRYGGLQDDELAIALPIKMYEKAVKGLEELYKRGIRYPIPFYGAEVDPSPGLFDAYGGKSHAKRVKKKLKRKNKSENQI
ncbi:MAG: DUF169 domain-containing protein [Candidatus Helarchaeota archaeon]